MRPIRTPTPHAAARCLFAAIAGLAAAAAVSGCRSAPAGETPTPTLTAAAIPAVTLTPADCGFSAEARTLFRSRLDGADRYLLIERTPTDDADPDHPGWTVHRSEGPTPDGPWTLTVEQHFITTERGDAALASETNHAEDAELTFQPPMIVMPASLPAGGTEFTQSIHLRVSPINKPGQLKAQGPVRVTIRHEGGDIVATDAGPLAAQRITRIFEAALKPADVLNTTRQWFAPGRGLIAEAREERTRIFSVPTRNNRESWVVVIPPPAP